MSFTNYPVFSGFPWQDGQAGGTALKATNLNAAQQANATDARAVAAALDAYLETYISQYVSQNAPPSSAALPSVNVSGTYTPTLTGAAITEIPFTLTGNGTIVLTGLPPGGQVVLDGTQDATGSRTLSVGNGSTTASVSLTGATASGATFRVVVTSPDGSQLEVPSSATVTNVLSKSPLIWDGAIASGTQVVYSGSTTAGDASAITLKGYGTIQGGLTNPLNDGGANDRVHVLAPFGAKAAKTAQVIRLRNWNTDQANKNTGQQSKPAASAGSPQMLGNYAAGTPNWHVFFGFSVLFPDGTGKLSDNTTSRGDNPFPVVPSFHQFFEDYGPPFTNNPVWQLCVRDGGQINANGSTLTSGVNYLHMASNMPPGYPAFWVASTALSYETWYDFVVEVGRSTTASTDSGVTGGFVNLWLNGVQQAFTAGASEDGSSSAAWTRVNSGKTLIVATLNSGDSGTGYGNWDSYRFANQYAGETNTTNGAADPVTTYLFRPRIGTTFASVDPST